MARIPTIVSDAFCEWAADRLLHDLRRGEVPETITPGDVAWHPMSTVLRARLADDDLELAKSWSADPQTVMWAALISRRFLEDAELTADLLLAFEVEADTERQIGLLHNLSARELLPDQRAILRAWLDANTEDWVAEQREAFADENGTERLHDRIRSSEAGFRAKRWVYMYSALILPPDEARSVLTQHADGDDPVVADAARSALERLV